MPVTQNRVSPGAHVKPHFAGVFVSDRRQLPRLRPSRSSAAVSCAVHCFQQQRLASVNPASGVTPTNIFPRIRLALPPDPAASIGISVSGVCGGNQTVNVALVVSAAQPAIAPPPLTFSAGSLVFTATPATAHLSNGFDRL